ncbi:hypothetical protein I6F26_33640 [Ensifer sp. IC3342]|nr:hypothetical protein [Ensifer sp. BRP08]MCA1451356.1 hypothetical protein [Ensifer sp. IC3342]
MASVLLGNCRVSQEMAGAQFPRNLVAAVPYATYTVLTHNGAQFTQARRTDDATSMTSGMERLPRQLCRFVDDEELIARVRAKLSAGYDRAQGALRSSENPTYRSITRRKIGA